MDPFLIASLCIAGMLVLVAVGVPVAVAMCVVSAIGMYAAAGAAFMLTTFTTLPFDVAANFTFAAIPMFVTMGIIAGSTGIVGDVFNSANQWLARVRGGLYMATTIASAAFGALNGSTLVSAVLFTRVALPEMIKLGYSRALAAGCIAGAGTFAAMIPPSISMIVYGILTGESIGRLLIAGILPGLLTGFAYIVGIGILVRVRPDMAPAPAAAGYPLAARMASLKSIWPIVILVFLVMGGIYSGAVSPAMAGAIGASGSIAIGFVMRKLSRKDLGTGMKEVATVTAVMFLIIIGGLLFSRLLLVTGFVPDLLDWIQALGLSRWSLLLILIVLYLILGMLMDPMSMIVMTIPVVHPLLTSLGFDGIWLAIIVIKLIELSCITPPIGINLFAVSGAARGSVTIGQIYVGVLPFVAIELAVLGVLIAFPAISLLLPSAMMGAG